MKKIYSALIVLLSFVSTYAYDLEYKGFYYDIDFDNKTMTVVHVMNNPNIPYRGYCSGRITIPSSIRFGDNDYKVTAIGTNAFNNCSEITSVTIPNSITKIERYAFYGCTSLSSVNIPESVSFIDQYAFDCENIDTLIWDNDKVTFSSSLFAFLPNLKHVTLGNIITETNPFEYCENLTSATILDGRTSIQDYLFGGCSGLTDISIPESVRSIGDGAFWSCTGLTSIDIPDGVKAIGNSAFKNCSNLKSFIIPAGIKTIENGTFSDCSSLTSIAIPESITRIEANAFEYCSDLSLVVLPDNLSFIGANAFAYCGLTNIVIPAHVDSIGVFYYNDQFYYFDDQFYIVNPFIGCSNLRSITIDPNNKRFDSRNNCNAIIETASNTLLACSNNTSFTIPESVTAIENGAFSGCKDLTSLVIPEKITKIETGALSGLSSLSSIVVDPNNTVYDSRDNCNALIETKSNTLILACKTTTVPESVTVTNEWTLKGIDWGKDEPDGVLYINDLLYGYKGNMPQGTQIVVRDGTKRIASSAFSGCTGLTSITIPESVTSIGYNAFGGCTGLKSITIPGSVENIEQGVFEGCSGLTAVYIQDGVTSIDYSAFEGCRSIKTISIPESMSYIDRRAFDYACYIDTLIWNSPNISPSVLRSYYNYSIKFVSIGNKVVQIGDNAFTYCPTLDSVVISEGVKVIGESAFSRCQALKSINIPHSVTTIGDNAFRDCSGLTEIEIPESVTNIGENIIFGCNSLPGGVWYINDILYCYIGQMPENTSFTVKDGTKSIANGAFANCDGLTSITIPDGVTSIGDLAFTGCYYLKSVTIPGSVTTIGNEAFSGCHNLTSVVIPDGVVTIGDKAFYNSSVRSISIPESVTSIGEFALNSNRLDTLYLDNPSIYLDEWVMGNNFYNVVKVYGLNYIKHRGLSSAIRSEWYESLPDGPVYLDNWFVGYKGVIPDNTQIEIKEGTIGIATFAFAPVEDNEDNGLITSVIIPESVTTIEGNAFCGSGITSITIPKNVTNIGYAPFNSCSFLTTIYVDPENRVYDSRNNCNAIIETASNSLIQGCSTTVIPASVTAIQEGAFSFRNELTSITIPEGVTVIGNDVFRGCQNLTSVILPEGLKSIGNSAFWGCLRLNSITIPKSVTNIGGSAFSDCRAITSIELPDGLTFISGAMFQECKELTSVIIPESVTDIGDCAFQGCTSLTEINIPNSVKTIGPRAFREITGLSSIPDGLTYIGVQAFEGCTGITSVNIPEDITYIGSDAFRYCTGIKTVSLPASMGGKEFQWFFEYSSDIESIYLHSSSPIRYYSLYNIDFDNCILYVPAGSKEIYRGYSPWSKFKNIRLLDECGLNIDGICYEITSDIEKTVSVVHHNYQGAVIIPSTVIIDGLEYEVTGIAREAFSECDKLTSVTIPATITEIEEGSFTQCHALSDIIFEGSPIIRKNVFIDCPNIERVISKSVIPGSISLNNPFIAGDCKDVLRNNRNKQMGVSAIYNNDLDRFVSKITSFSNNKQIKISSDLIPAGSYHISIGILPSPDGLPNNFHPIVNAYIGDTKTVLLDSIVVEEVELLPGLTIPCDIPQQLISKGMAYDSLVISDALIIPEGCTKIEILLKSEVSDFNYDQYSSTILIDRVFIEPLDDIALESYCGPFTENVFNNATLYVQEEAIGTYRNAEGWKLFKNIAIDTGVKPIMTGTARVSANSIIYDMTGRKVLIQDFERLQPGLYIIDGKKYLKR